MAVRTKWVFGLLAVFVLCGAGLIALGMWLGGHQVEVKSNSTLVVDLPEDIEEDLPPDVRTDLFYEDQPTLWETVHAIRHAAKDPHIHALLLKTEGIDWGWGKIEELHDAIADFADSGKTVVAWMEGGDERDYYLCSVADEVYMPPQSMLRVDGFAAYVSFLKGTLDKVGVVADMEHIGEFKDAADPLTRKNMSEPSKEALNALLDDRYADFLAGVADARGITVDEVRQKVDQGPYRSEDAMATGLIDSVLYEDQVDELLPGGEDGPRIDLEDYVSHDSYGPITAPRIGIVFASGTIVPGKSGYDPVWGRTLGHETLTKALNEARDDDKVKAIVLRVDSPGGDTYASNAMWRAVREANKEKPVIASFSDLAASGGYYLAMGADSLVAEPGTLTGSIGVLGGKFNLSGLYQKIGMSVEVLSRGENAQFYSPVRSFTPAEREKFVSQLWSDYKTFIGIVAQNRKQTPEAIDALARGRVWTGGQAYERSLVDTLGGFETAIALAKKKAGIGPNAEVRYVVYPKVQRPFLRRLVDQLWNSPDENTQMKLRVPGLDVLRSLARLANRPSLTWMPYTIEIH
ncbi:MAG TPA: signal peptide peptidase SppA [Candidatus Eisenbacteria bacterium]|nr:signal peptide peptidase SppA [Candidatus Eisenbacteria bacterium]